ncbi:MAG: alpha/beta hydrolase [Henriciella sp.]
MIYPAKRSMIFVLAFFGTACAMPGMVEEKAYRSDPISLRERAAALKALDPSPDLTISYDSETGKSFPINVFRSSGSCPDGGWPGLVMYHGGGWQRGEPTQFKRQAKLYNELGFSLLMPGYSLGRVDGTPPQQSLRDAVTAWTSIIDRAEELCLDVSKLGAGGGSAGGHLGAALATLSEDKAPSLVERPKFLVLYNPVIDNSPEGYGYERIGEDWTWFSPLHNIPASHPDTLFMLGDEDALIPVSTAESYCARVQENGADCRLIVYEGAAHAWFNDSGFVDTLTDSAEFLSDWLVSSENEPG